MQWYAKKVGVPAEVLGPYVYRVCLPANRVNLLLLLTTLVGIDSAEEKEKLARLT
jgi:hypothetical protein